MTILTRGYGQTDRLTDQPTDIATYRAAIAAKNHIGYIILVMQRCAFEEDDHN